MMRISKLLAATAAAVALTPAVAMAEPARTFDIAPGDRVPYEGTQATGVNALYFPQSSAAPQTGLGRCDTTPAFYCDTTLVNFTNPVPETDADGSVRRNVVVSISDFRPLGHEGADFDLVVFSADADGNRIAEVGRSAGFMQDELVVVPVTTTREAETAHLVVDVVYWSVVHSTFSGLIKG